jgi:hypothetical protein
MGFSFLVFNNNNNSTNGEKRNAHKLLVGKPQGKRQLGKPRCRWMNNIKMEIGEVG